MRKNKAKVQKNILDLLDKLGDVCDAEDVSTSEELSAVSMLLCVVAFRAGYDKEKILVSMGNTIDHMYTALNQEDEEQPCDQE